VLCRYDSFEKNSTSVGEFAILHVELSFETLQGAVVLFHVLDLAISVKAIYGCRKHCQC
jgi:hypothetical protein